MVLLSLSLFLSGLLTFLPDGVVKGFWNSARAPKSQKLGFHSPSPQPPKKIPCVPELVSWFVRQIYKKNSNCGGHPLRYKRTQLLLNLNLWVLRFPHYGSHVETWSISFKNINLSCWHNITPISTRGGGVPLAPLSANHSIYPRMVKAHQILLC